MGETEGDKFKRANVFAVTSLASATSTATEFGFTQVAEAGEKVQYVLIRVIQPTLDVEKIAERDINKLQERIRKFEHEIASLPNAQTQSFKCQRDFEDCLERAKSTTMKATCWVSYAACLAEQFTTLASKPSP